MTGPVEPATIAAVSGGGQSGLAGAVLPQPFIVRVLDSRGDPAAGVAVSWGVTQGGGATSASESLTNGDGEASVTLTLGPFAGTNAVAAAAQGLTGSPVQFMATGNTPPTTIFAVSSRWQSGLAGAVLPDPFIVRVLDSRGDPAAGVAVTWAVTQGGGSLSASETLTDGDGETSVRLTLGPSAGSNEVTAAVDGLTGSPVRFAATGAVPATLELVSGDGQNGKTGEPLDEPFVVRVRDEAGLPLGGVDVDWKVVAGTGFVVQTVTTTDDAGLASTLFFAQAPVGTSVAEASVVGLAGAPQTFTVRTTVWVVLISNSAYADWTPENGYTIAVGDTIEWLNLDDPTQTGAHTVTSSSAPAGGSVFDSGTLSLGERFRFVPGVAGVWDYFCEVHGAGVMSGRLTVAAAGRFP